ncbi:MAG: dTDP-4-dehydrorhamnose 3,5-epimerase [Candidatus Omnitrophica bacterium]|nr:dTDP-4-dehydrorhamnose 3,5-epimerase [Candidatus Omnitrophota bacterium]
MINDVKIKNLKVICDERGRLMEILRKDDELFLKFGQVYITTAFPGVVKAWHYHKKQTDNIACINGKAVLALYDARETSSTFKEVNEFVLSLEESRLVHIPPMVYHGFKCMSDEEAFLINIPDKTYNYKKPDEFRIDPYHNNINYNWRKS